MKKILALLLALLMVASVALVSCDSADANDGEDNDFVDDFGGLDDGEDGESDDADADDEDAENTSNSMEAVNDTVYVLYTAKIRATASENGTVLVSEVPFGASLARSGKSSEWCKVTYEGQTGYIMTDLITTNGEAVVFEDQGKAGEGENAEKVYPTTTVKGTAPVRLRFFPLANGYPNTLTILDSDALGQVGQVKGGDEVTILEISKDKKWAKVRSAKVDVAVQGSFPKTYSETKEGYIPCDFLNISGGQGSSTNGGPSTLG